MAVRVVVGEDEPLVREGIVRVLERAGFDVVGAAGDAPDLLRKANAHKPDVVVTDIEMPPGKTDDGLRAALEIRRARPETGVVVLSQFLEDRYALELVGDRAEGVGYLLKERVGDLNLFADSVRRVAAGGSALDPQVVQRMVGRRGESGPLDQLTPREREVMALMAEGRSNGGIAAELTVTVPAVERHVTNISTSWASGRRPKITGACWRCSSTSGARSRQPPLALRSQRSSSGRRRRTARSPRRRDASAASAVRPQARGS